MSKSHKQQPNPPAGSKGDGDALAGSTLEDYFASHKVSGHVSQHLLNVSADNDVMAADQVDDEGPGRVLAAEVGSSSERKSEQDGYEDGYESEASAPKAEPPSDLAGMTLSDYLHVSDTTAQEKLSRAGSLRTLPPQLAPAAKKAAPTSDVSGMSLDHYLGASTQAGSDDKAEHDSRADKKPSPKVKRRSSKAKPPGPALPQAKPVQQPFSVKGSGIIHGPLLSSTPHSVSSDEESGSAGSPGSGLTPFQRHQKRKDRAKAKQQRHAGSGASVSKAILMADAPTTMLSVRDREKRRTSLTVVNPSAHQHHQSHYGSHSSASSFQPPLPKLAVSSSVRSLSHKDHDTSVSGSDDDAAEKLPPL